MTNNTEVTNLPLSDIKVDRACQVRAAGLDPTVVDEYARIMKEEGDDRFPAIVVYFDSTDYWLSDGFHRYAAAEKAGLSSLKARIRPGSQRDAILNSVGTNANHGLRRSNADKRHAVTILLEDEEWSTWSNREIARRCAVDEGLVRKIKEELGLSSSVSADNPQIARTVKRNDTVYEMKTDNIGKRDGLDEVLSVEPDRDVQPDQTWLVRPDTGAAEEDTGEDIADDERGPVSDPASGTEEVQLQELLSAWARASAQVRRQFLASIDSSLTPQANTGSGVIETEHTQEPEPSREPIPSQPAPLQAAESSATEPQENALFEMWKDYKPNTQVDGRKWVADGCPSDYQDRHFTITERLVPFRDAALAATPEERDQFWALSGAVIA
jgi:hypothetical protein